MCRCLRGFTTSISSYPFVCKQVAAGSSDHVMHSQWKDPACLSAANLTEEHSEAYTARFHSGTQHIYSILCQLGYLCEPIQASRMHLFPSRPPYVSASPCEMVKTAERERLFGAAVSEMCFGSASAGSEGGAAKSPGCHRSTASLCSTYNIVFFFLCSKTAQIFAWPEKPEEQQLG